MAAALCYGVRGSGAQLAFHVQAGNHDTDSLIQVLGELRRFLGGEKATLLWDGLPAHRSTAMRAWLAAQRSWLVIERLPAYAPDLNPVEGLWSSLKASSWPTSPAPPWPKSSSKPIEASTGSAALHTWPTHSCGMLACRWHDALVGGDLSSGSKQPTLGRPPRPCRRRWAKPVTTIVAGGCPNPTATRSTQGGPGLP